MGVGIGELWLRGTSPQWNAALENYWSYVQDRNKALERELDTIPLSFLKELDANGWYKFLLEKYFRWKYTAPNRYATTTAHLRKYCEPGQMSELDNIRKAIINLRPDNVREGLQVATKIRGLGTAGASGLLSLIHPGSYGTVDQFAVKALRAVPNLPEGQQISKMKEMGLTVDDGVLLISIMKRKADSLNAAFGGGFWTPRKVDKVLWTFGR